MKIAAFALGLALVSSPVSTAQNPQSCELYIYSGWNGSDRNGDADIEGRVGYQLEVSGPGMNCTFPGGFGQAEVLSGSLPPGLIRYVGSQSWGRIAGTPTERGHYIARLRYDIYCGAQTYAFEQTVRFHITGSGVVVQ